MRMIDADALEKALEDTIVPHRLIAIIRRQPTIEAEPTYEQILDYCKERDLTIIPKDTLRKLQAESDSDIKWQGRYCIECLYSSTCYGAGIDKPACKSFVPRVRYVDCSRKDGGENDSK